MRRLPVAAIVAAVSTIALTQIASAADQGPPVHKAPVYKGPPPPPAPVYTWTGFYVGGNVGGGWGRANTDIAGNGSLTTNGSTEFPNGSGPFTTSFPFGGSNPTHPNGVVGGGQAGYNYQFSPSGVLGLEADIQGSGERGSTHFSIPFDPTFCAIASSPTTCTTFGEPIIGAAVTTYQAKIDWFGTVRGRVGVLVGDQLLIYGTGGLAYGNVAVSGTTNFSASQTGLPPGDFRTFIGTAGFSGSKTNVGFAVGGGVEGRLSYWLPPNWTWKLEYLYLDLGSLDTTTSFVLPLVSNIGKTFFPVTGTANIHTHITDNIVRVGLNYKFDYAAAPALYK
jgi:outer membrane immunogenic protein